MIILGVDLETTGIPEEEGESEIIEGGFVLYDTELEMVLAQYGMIYKTETESAEGAYNIHKISRDVSLRMPSVSESPNPYQVVRADLADYIVAHNAPHDHPKVVKAWPIFLEKPWICTQRDLDHDMALPRPAYSRRLGHLCVDYNINLAGWHRAVADAEACARLAGKHDLNASYEYKCLPKFRLIVFGPYLKDIDAYAALCEAPSITTVENNLSRGRKYRWNQEGYPKAWVKENLTEEFVTQDADYIKKFTGGQWKFNLERMDPPVY